ncbi:Methyltransferase-like protein 7A-like protein [Hapsidospora chrysogenum ATCC 11550]|uniref:Methyltransferase-like protein 7A-like protein n=1 Tax=Hapsidospora chrysogenum (strain ATCC 11550 / CBS 779.69 / DSM 880 / IAM 14645 / JCM 23072 / IMI 49137) TaxID=857340 RepID=A0A086T8K4_HAPC1|nr:Methyltransferase-like protein 7A-like protein [Hapsidospora chrysogenum ATCC 11550]
MLKDIWAVVKPWFFICISTTFFFITVAKLISEGDLDTLRSKKKFGEAWFGNLWRFVGPKAQAEAEGWVISLLEGRVENGRAAVKTDAVSHALEGVVLEVGAGSGMWTKVLADIALASETGEGRTPIKVYGVEPNPMSAAALKRRVEQLGLDGRYEVIPAGIEDLEKESPLKPGSVDCIMTVQCLCSIPEPEKNMRLLYEYLKKGGRWYVYEHVRADEGVFIPAFQKFTNFFWKRLMGTCQLCRPTTDTLHKIGEWESIDLAVRSTESRYAAMPHVVGTLKKAV